jgi:hypothetical protein
MVQTVLIDSEMESFTLRDLIRGSPFHVIVIMNRFGNGLCGTFLELCLKDQGQNVQSEISVSALEHVMRVFLASPGVCCVYAARRVDQSFPLQVWASTPQSRTKHRHGGSNHRT